MKSDGSWMPDETDLDWIEATAPEPHAVLVAMEAAAEPERIPILDRASGRVLATLAATRSRIVEVGTAIGYSTLWMGLAQPAGGRIVTIDPDRARTDRARGFWRQAGIADGRIDVVNARALDAFAAGIPELAGPFDLAFVDALKDEYPAYA
ncbi:MAG TPA: class I SAM-dependent methyltransferase, partial [Candidatus Limnocylindrales bacterium]|nr:class I SAM-dependent methyltransferase [Candidatus Limnocylindrales bacterium]